jgi:hypothetical protein
MHAFCLLFLLLACAQVATGQGLIPYQQGTLWGYRTAAGKVRITPRYQHAEAFAGGLAKVWRASKCGYINTQGREVIPVRWDAASYHEDSITWLNEPLPHWPAARQWVLVMQFDSLLRPNLWPTWSAEPWQPGARLHPAGYRARNLQRLGFYTPAGQVVLPAYYSSFRALSPQYFAAAIAGERVDAGFYLLDGHPRGSLTEFTTQLVHRSGRRLALGGRRFNHITALYSDTLVVNGGNSGYNVGYTYEVNLPAELVDTTGRRLVWQSPGPHPEQFRTLTPLGGHGGLWLAEYHDRHYADHLRYCLLRPDGTLALAAAIASAKVLAPGQALVSVGTSPTTIRYGLLALPGCTWLIQPQFGMLESLGEQGFLVAAVPTYLWGAIRADGRPWIPCRYTKLVACRTQSGQLLPYWYAERGSQTWLLDADGQPLLTLTTHSYYAERRSSQFQQFLPNLTLVLGEWKAKKEAVIQLDTTQGHRRASLTLRPQPRR